jgi:hypothetical protein
VLALAVRPPPLLPETHAVTVELIPPLTPPVPPPLPVLRRLSEDETPPQPPQPLKPTARPEVVLPQPTEAARPAPPAPRPLSAPPRAPDLTPPAPLPPAPLEVARPQPALPRPVAIPAPAPSRTILADRPAPPVLQPSPPAPAPAPAQVQVLTNQQVIQAPIEIRPPDRTVNPLSTAPPTPPVILNPEGAGAAAGSGALAGGGGAPSGGAGAGARLGGPVVGFGDALRGGLRMRLGCATPDTYKLSPQERAECLRRLAEEAKAAVEMGINIPPAKQAEFDRQRACHAATTQGGVPSSTSQTTGGSTRGLGDPLRLRDCGPGDR